MGTLIDFVHCEKCKEKAIYKISEKNYCKKHVIGALDDYKLLYPLYVEV